MEAQNRIIAVVGRSNTGKTTLITKLIDEFKKRHYSVGIIKHCLGGFEIDKEGKDSWRFSEAGADQVMLASPEKMTLIINEPDQLSIREIVQKYLKKLDIILVEGYFSDKTVKKLEVVTGDKPQVASEELAAVISNNEINLEKPVFQCNDITGIVDFLEETWKKR